jgi:hypothetical protein
MAYAVGFRKVQVYNSVPANTLTPVGSERGEYVLIEVTNATASTVNITLNDYPDQGHIGTAIPVPANTTRQIPVATYNFKADGVVTVVAYGM